MDYYRVMSGLQVGLKSELQVDYKWVMNRLLGGYKWVMSGL